MDSQFNSLVRSYSDNYIQHKVTGNPRYQTAYAAAQQGMDSILSQLQESVDTQKQHISEFYNSDVEEKLSKVQQQTRFLERSLVKQEDELTAANMRSTPPSPLAFVQTWQVVALGVLGVTAVALSAL